MNTQDKDTVNAPSQCPSKTIDSIVVVGLGYIGLPTAVILAEAGWKVIGVDVSPSVVESVNAGRLPFVEPGLEDSLMSAVNSGGLVAQQTMPKADAFVIAVPTPFKEGNEPDLSYIEAAADAVASVLTGGELLILESTVPPGATEHMAERVLATRADLSIDGSDGRPVVGFVHAPERVLPGRILTELRCNDRVIGGLTPQAAESAAGVYRTFCEGDVSTTDARTAELAKLAENAFRDVNIAFANELALIAERQGVDAWELIELANKHPRVQILQPGPGVGGHCIAVDPWFIVASDRENSALIRTAREVNDAKPERVVRAVEEQARARNSQRPVAVLGLAFKPNVDDLRQSPAVEITKALASSNKDTEFLVVEPHIVDLPEVLRGFSNLRLASLEDALESASVVALLVDHDAFRALPDPGDSGKAVVDTRGLWRGRG